MYWLVRFIISSIFLSVFAYSALYTFHLLYPVALVVGFLAFLAFFLAPYFLRLSPNKPVVFLFIQASLLVIPLLIALLVPGARYSIQNPDPNHTHADFAVWIDGTKLDFSSPEYMSGTSDEHDPNHTKHDPYLHLHDGNGNVIHRHKPNLSIQDFFQTIGVTFYKEGLNVCLSQEKAITCEDEVMHKNWVMIVNGVRQQFFDPSYVFNDEDQILIVLPRSTDDTSLFRELESYQEKMTQDACLYSQTCLWRGKPPVENCIADPTVPCTQ